MVQELKHFTETIQSIPQITPSTALIDDRKAKVYTDVVIKCKDKTFNVHRVIIASQSPFFKSKLERWETDDRSIDMSDLDPQIVEAIINFMYAEKIPSINTLAPDLLAASEQYQLSALKNLCEKTLIKRLTESRALSLLKQAISHNAHDLQLFQNSNCVCLHIRKPHPLSGVEVHVPSNAKYNHFTTACWNLSNVVCNDLFLCIR